MKQLTQKLGSGQMQVQEVPLPLVGPGSLLVRNHYSLISAGTEGSTIRAARKSLLGKAKERPQQVRQVLDALQRVGPVQTYRAVTKKLDAYSPLGYSCVGEVIGVGAHVQGFAIGDRVACAGGTANHAEAVSVATNLCVPISTNSDMRSACYNTLGAIALQGVRQADLRLGESCVVIGLGLIGQLTCLMLKASGVNVYGVDVDGDSVERARQRCVDDAWRRGDSGIVDRLLQHTNGIGADGVIITAATRSLDPINFAGELARHRGRVVVVGDVPTGFDREPNFYRKELELRMSCSYGPGRYDLNYEEHGLDYPVGYVRWTENRNMRAFQSMVESQTLNLNYLTTHEFSLDEVTQAYDMILERTEPFLGVVIRYDLDEPLSDRVVPVRAAKPKASIGVAFVGAGSYAQSNLLPHLPVDDATVSLRTVMTQSGTTSKRVAEKFGFETCSTSVAALCRDNVDLWFIATRHDSHADYVLKGLNAGKHVFVEKPLALDREGLDAIHEAYGRTSEQGTTLTVGFNRRFAPLTMELKSRLSDAPMSMLYRINAGRIDASSWIHDPSLGGGRMIGEGCHFIDLMTHLCGARPVSVVAHALPDANSFDDTLSVQLSFENGSIGTLHYFANGSKGVAKEYLEVYQHGVTAILDDFKALRIAGTGKPFRKRLINQDKGQSGLVAAVFEAVKMGTAAPIPFEDLMSTTLATFAVADSLTTRGVIAL